MIFAAFMRLWPSQWDEIRFGGVEVAIRVNSVLSCVSVVKRFF